jgi:hypothetical protein
MKQKIKSINEGWGEGSVRFAVNDMYQYAPFGNRIHEIKGEEKLISWNCGQPMDSILCYRGYDVEGNVLFEIETNSALAIYFENINDNPES